MNGLVGKVGLGSHLARQLGKGRTLRAQQMLIVGVSSSADEQLDVIRRSTELIRSAVACVDTYLPSCVFLPSTPATIYHCPPLPDDTLNLLHAQHPGDDGSGGKALSSAASTRRIQVP